jgi:pyrimidine deaminase RibD-like protein
MNPHERKFMKAAIEAARKSRLDVTGSVPRVGAVAIIGDQIVGSAHREEFDPGQHAEYVLLEKHLPSASLVNATVYTTLEPCTKLDVTGEFCTRANVRETGTRGAEAWHGRSTVQNRSSPCCDRSKSN